MMRAPRFWDRDVDPKSREGAPLTRVLLTPLAALYASVTARKLASPMVKAGNMMLKAMTNANCRRDRISASSSMAEPPDQSQYLLIPIRPRKHDESMRAVTQGRDVAASAYR